MRFSVSRCTLADARNLSLIAQATFLEAFSGVLPGKAITAHCQDRLNTPSLAMWLAEPEARLWIAHTRPDGAPIGYVGIATPNLPISTTPDDIELKRIYVFSRFYGTGVGAALMEAATTEAGIMRKRQMFLGVYAANSRAIAFYHKSGFRKIGTRQFKVGDLLCDDLVMARDLE